AYSAVMLGNNPKPTGTVAFVSMDGTAVVLCTATLLDGSGSCSTTATPPGIDQVVTAEYSGSPTSGVTTGYVTDTVDDVPTTTTVTVSPSTGASPSPVTLSATVTSPGGVPTG